MTPSSREASWIELVTHDSNVDEVVNVCHKSLKQMGLQITKEESTKEGEITVLDGEDTLVPLVTRAYCLH